MSSCDRWALAYGRPSDGGVDNGEEMVEEDGQHDGVALEGHRLQRRLTSLEEYHALPLLLKEEGINVVRMRQTIEPTRRSSVL